MTKSHVVADDVLGRISRKIWELLRRILEGSVDPERALAILQPALEGVPKPLDEGSSYGTYLLESRWSWDNRHNEFVTIGLEKCDSSIPFEELLNPAAPEAEKRQIMGMLRRIYDAQVPQHGGHKMLRLYRILNQGCFGYDPSIGMDGTLKRDAVDLHFILKPLFDFDDKGQPIPCKIRE